MLRAVANNCTKQCTLSSGWYWNRGRIDRRRGGYDEKRSHDGQRWCFINYCENIYNYLYQRIQRKINKHATKDCK